MRFEDVRRTLPRHGTKRFLRRRVSGIKGIVLHQTAGGDSVFRCASYHTGPNHVCPNGCPGLLYTFFVDQAGRVYWANDLEAATYSQGGKGTPIPGTSPNAHFLAIVCGGDFDGPTYTGDDRSPSALQLHAVLELVLHLTGERQSESIPSELYEVLSAAQGQIYGHAQFGKANCPGLVLQAIADGIRSRTEDQGRKWTARDYQEALERHGYIKATEVDGVWGPVSRGALTRFQSDHDLEPDGLRGPLTRARLME